MPEELKGKSGEAPATLAHTDEALRLTVSGSPIMLLPRELVHVQWERESLFTGLLAAAGSTFLSALWLSRQEDRDLDTWVAAAMMASLGQAYLLGAWILRQTTLWLGTGKASHRLSFWRWRHRRVLESRRLDRRAAHRPGPEDHPGRADDASAVVAARRARVVRR